MRVIAGEKKGMGLFGPPKSGRTRPTKDQVKESVFNMLGPVAPGLVFLDLFAGTGQMGIEFLSRGGQKAIFIEQSGPMVGMIKRNLAKTAYENQALLLHGDYRQRLDDIGGLVDVVYVDPPYGLDMVGEALSLLRTKQVLKPGALVIVEASVEDGGEIAEGFRLLREKTQKLTRIQFLQEAFL